MRIGTKARVKLMGRLQQIIATFPDEVRLDQYPRWGARIPESAMEIHILLRQCQYKFEKQGVVDIITIGMINRRVLEIEKELYGTNYRSTGAEKHIDANPNRYDLFKESNLFFPLDDWKRFYSEIESLLPTGMNN
jgi:hypothetical protein